MWKGFDRFNNQAHHQCGSKCNATAWNLYIAAYYVGGYLAILDAEEKYRYEGAPLEVWGIHARAEAEIGYHLDALLANLRILADCIAYAIPFFYSNLKEKITVRSFRDQLLWFTKKRPSFDPEYTDVLRERSEWFEQLAGKNSAGLRDRVFHRRATYQLGRRQYHPAVKHTFYVDQVTEEGTSDQPFLATLSAMMEGFFLYLDGTYELFERRIISELQSLVGEESSRPSLLSATTGERSRYLQFEDVADFERVSRVFPFIGARR